MTFCDSLLSGGARKRRKKQLNYLLESRVVWEQEKKKTCQTRCKVVRPGKKDRTGEGTGMEKGSFQCGTSFDSIDLWLTEVQTFCVLLPDCSSSAWMGEITANLDNQQSHCSDILMFLMCARRVPARTLGARQYYCRGGRGTLRSSTCKERGYYSLPLRSRDIFGKRVVETVNYSTPLSLRGGNNQRMRE